MKKILLTFICCLTLLLYIPFNISAETYNGDFDSLGLSQIQKDKVQELFDDSYLYNDYIIYFNSSNLNLYWAYDNIQFDSSNSKFTFSTRFLIDSNGNLLSYTDSTYAYLNGSLKFIYAKYQGDDIFKNNNLSYSSTSENYLLFEVTNSVTNTVNGCTQSPNNNYYYGNVTVYYDSIINITGYNFDVYYLVDNTYRLIQENVNSFEIIESDFVYKNQSTGNTSSCIYPTAPSIPKNSRKTYQSSFKYKNFYFVINDEIDLNTIIVKAPDTDSLISDGNSISQSATSNNNQSNQILDNAVNQMESLENDFKNDLNSNLNNINSNDFNISGITQLSNAANFVRVQFDNLTKNNPFGIILGFSLFLGLSLLVIGKRL